MEMVQNKKLKMMMGFISVLLNLIKKKKLEQMLNLKFMKKIKNGVLDEILKDQKKKISIEFILFIVLKQM